RAQGRSDLEELELNELIGSEQGAAGDAEQEAVADLAGSAGDSNAYGRGHLEGLLVGTFGGFAPGPRTLPSGPRPSRKGGVAWARDRRLGEVGPARVEGPPPIAGGGARPVVGDATASGLV